MNVENAGNLSKEHILFLVDLLATLGALQFSAYARWHVNHPHDLWHIPARLLAALTAHNQTADILVNGVHSLRYAPSVKSRSELPEGQ